MKRTVFVLTLIFLASCIAAPSISAQKISPDEVVAKHLGSIGKTDKLAAVSNQLIVFDTQFNLKGSAVVVRGKSLILSAGERNLWGMNFNSNDYPQDRFGFDGKETKVGRATPSARSLLGDFLYNYREIIREGLLGGTLTSSWPLLKLGERKAKLSYEGTKNINGSDMIALSYVPKGGSDLSIKLYFDPQTYRHVRTEYTLLRAAAQGPNVDASAGQTGTIYRLVEDFSNFKKMGELTLPATYKITYSRTGTGSTALAANANREAEWTFNVTDIGFNREIDDNSFNIEG